MKFLKASSIDLDSVKVVASNPRPSFILDNLGFWIQVNLDNLGFQNQANRMSLFHVLPAQSVISSFFVLQGAVPNQMLTAHKSLHIMSTSYIYRGAKNCI